MIHIREEGFDQVDQKRISVRVAQRGLVQLGFRVRIDGIFGPETSGALGRWLRTLPVRRFTVTPGGDLRSVTISPAAAAETLEIAAGRFQRRIARRRRVAPPPPPPPPPNGVVPPPPDGGPPIGLLLGLGGLAVLGLLLAFKKRKRGAGPVQ